MTKKEIGAILMKLRENSHKSREEVADLLGKSVKTIGHWETGYAQPDANTLFLLCTIYGADINDAFGFTTKKDPANRSVDEARAWAIAAIDQMSDEDFEAVAPLLRRLKDKYKDK